MKAKRTAVVKIVLFDQQDCQLFVLFLLTLILCHADPSFYICSEEKKVGPEPEPEPTDFRSVKMVDYDFEFESKPPAPTRVILHFDLQQTHTHTYTCTYPK